MGVVPAGVVPAGKVSVEMASTETGSRGVPYSKLTMRVVAPLLALWSRESPRPEKDSFSGLEVQREVEPVAAEGHGTSVVEEDELAVAGLNSGARGSREEPPFWTLIRVAGTSVCVPLFVAGNSMSTGDEGGDVAGDRGSSKLQPAYIETSFEHRINSVAVVLFFVVVVWCLLVPKVKTVMV